MGADVLSQNNHKMSVNPLQEMENPPNSGQHDCLCNISRLLLGKESVSSAPTQQPHCSFMSRWNYFILTLLQRR